ncbi:MAG: response regulator [Pseudomonadota bacterium]
MTLKQHSLALIFLASVIAALAALGSGFAIDHVKNETRHMLVAEEVLKDVSRMRFLLIETAFYHEQRSTLQWQTQVATLRRLLAAQAYSESQQTALLEKLKSLLTVMERLYGQLVKVDAGANNVELTARIVSELFVGSQEMLDDAFELMRLSRLDVEAAQSDAHFIMILSLGCMALLTVGAWLIIRQRVLQPIRLLQLGTERVGAGDLSFRTHLNTPNEIGLLANTFDTMTSKLEYSQKSLAKVSSDLRAVLDNVPALVAYWDAALVNRFANGAYLEWFGKTPVQILGKHMREVIGEAQFRPLEPYLQYVMKGNTAVFERAIDYPNGDKRHALFSYVPDIEDGVVKGLYGILSDVTALKEAQLDRVAALDQLQNVFDSASEFSIIVMRRDGTVKLFSRGSEKMLGYTALEVVDKLDPAVFHDATEIAARSQELTRQYGRPVQGMDVVMKPALRGSVETRQWTYIRRDGVRVPVSLTVTPVRDALGEITGFLSIAKDMTAELGLRQTLSEARDQAEAANRAKSEFLANMSHEIRTPMNAILGMLQLLQQTALEHRQQDYAHKAEAAARALLGILNDILDFSKVEAGKLVLDLQPLSIGKLLGDVAAILTTAVGDKDIEVLFEVDTDLPDWLMADAMRLQQVLINLAGNAIKFTEHGDVILSVRHVVPRGDVVPRLEFSVRDTGIGIAPEQCERIFEGFSQAEASTARRYGGTGLGLSISQRLVRLMGGSLSVRSQLGQGSSFSFSIPCVVTTGPPLRRPGGTGHLHNLHCLVVDDNGAARQAMAGMLESLGWHAEMVGSGPEAVAAVAREDRRQDTYDVIFVDWRMPGMDGIETCERIRNVLPAKRTPLIVMVTAHGREVLAQRQGDIASVLDGFLVKPVTASMLFDTVANAHTEERLVLKQIGNRAPQRLSGLRLLLVEDNLVNQQVARELLSHEGAVVEVADSGATALAAVQQAQPPYDVVLMDIQMPDMDGHEATRQIRQRLGLQSLPIIAMTANALQSDREAALAAGMNDHIGKPFDLSTLVAIIRQHTGSGQEAFTFATAATTTQQETRKAPHRELNATAALARFNGQTDTFQLALRGFVHEARVLMNSLPLAFARQVHKDAVLQLHTLKGLAATVGAEHLAGLASDMELAQKAGAHWETQGKALANLLQAAQRATQAAETLEKELAVSTRQATAKPPVQPSNAVTLQADLQTLLPLLDGANLHAVAVFERLRQRHGGHLPEVLAQLQPLVEQLEFEAAARQCRAYLQPDNPSTLS